MDTKHCVVNMSKSLEYIAYFEPTTKSFSYNYGNVAPLKKEEITLDRNNLKETQFLIPQKTGYDFCGWYADSDYKLKVVHENGKLMLGYQTFNLETDTLYARWNIAGQEKKVYKILMIMVDETYANLYSKKAGKEVLVNYKMSGVDRKICSVIPPKLLQYFNRWFNGKVIFEIDSYFTQEVIKEESFNKSTIDENHLMGNDIAEVNDIINEYECTFVTMGLPYNGIDMPIAKSGLGGAKHAYCNLGVISGPHQNDITAIINYNGNGELDVNESMNGLSTIVNYFHEFCHTIELRYFYSSYLPEFSQYTEEVYGFHQWGIDSNDNSLETIRLYLLKQGVVNGKEVGVPTSYWEEFFNGGRFMT